MSVPSVELQIKVIHFDKANQAFWRPITVGMNADSLLDHFDETLNDLVYTCDEEADTDDDSARAWVSVARNAVRYVRRRYGKYAGVHESMLLLSEKHADTVANQFMLYHEAFAWHFSHLLDDVYSDEP